jgi:DNA-binding SARP family transcriptional activator
MAVGASLDAVRRGDPPGPVGPDAPVMISLLGSFLLLARDEPVPLRGGGKAESLLTILALSHPDGVRREALLCSLWPSAPVDLAGQSLRTLLYSLHRRLGPALAGAPPVVRRGGDYRLNAEAGVAVDSRLFEALVLAADRALRDGDGRTAASLNERAVDLYRGDLCSGSDVSALIERERLRARYLNVRAWLAEYHFAGGDGAETVHHALALLSTEPCREDAHRLLMRCYAREGRRAEALRQYKLCQMILRDEFDVAPEPRTTELYDRVRFAPESV